jgi:hypothetical protein
MLVLFDHGTPAPLRSFLRDHIVKKTKDLGWDTLSNGELLRAAEEAAFEVFLTTDKNMSGPDTWVRSCEETPN